MPTSRKHIYAAEIYRLEERYAYVPLSELAEHLDVSLQAASRMIRRLQEEKLIEHKAYQGVRLTQSGIKAALPAIRRHRLAEVFLVQVMGFGWDEAHELTDDLERGLNQIIEDRFDQMTGYPVRCPHGEPIPTREGVMPVVHDVRLTSLQPNEQAYISRVKTHDANKLRYFGELNLRPGVLIELISIEPFDGPVRIRMGSQEQVLGYDLACRLRVTQDGDSF